MRKHLFVLVVGVALAAPLFASALTLADLQAQLASLQARIQQLLSASSTVGTISGVAQLRVCSAPGARSLGVGSRGADVADLQEFLRAEGFFSAESTGYFGSITAQALARWQSAQGIDAVGIAGPLTRERLRVRCGSGAGSCTPLPYAAPHCASGAAQPIKDEEGCTVGYTCPVDNFTPPTNCRAWNDGCNECSRQTPGGPAACTKRACFAAGKGYCSLYFTSTPTNQPPVVSGFSGPTLLAAGDIGTWSLRTYDPEDGSLTYSIQWGDERELANVAAQTYAESSAVQDTSFTHSYSAPGSYTITVLVVDDAGNQSRATAGVRVQGAVACTLEYVPVCGRPPGCATTCTGTVCPAICRLYDPQTYGNRCALQAAGAELLYDGECRSS